MKKALSETGWGYLFVGPTLLGYLVFVLGPLIAAVALSFTHYDMMSAPRAVGLKNYAHLAADPRLLTVYRNTALFAFVSVGLTVGLGVLLAVAVNQRLPGVVKYALRTAYFFPVLVGMMINTLQEFDSIVALTNGGPGDASRTVVMYIYDQAFRSFNMGDASAIAVTLFALISALTLLRLWASRRWVTYA